MDSHGEPQDVAGALLPGRSGQDTLTSDLFPGSRVLLLFVGDAVYRECTDSEESDRHAMDKKLRQRARLRVMVDHLLSDTSGSITLLERCSTNPCCNTTGAGRVTSVHDFFVRKTVSCWKRRRKLTVLWWRSKAPPVVSRSVSLAAIEKFHSQENVWAVHGWNSGIAQLCVPSRTTISASLTSCV